MPYPLWKSYVSFIGREETYPIDDVAGVGVDIDLTQLPKNAALQQNKDHKGHGNSKGRFSDQDGRWFRVWLKQNYIISASMHSLLQINLTGLQESNRILKWSYIYVF